MVTGSPWPSRLHPDYTHGRGRTLHWPQGPSCGHSGVGQGVTGGRPAPTSGVREAPGGEGWAQASRELNPASSAAAPTPGPLPLAVPHPMMQLTDQPPKSGPMEPRLGMGHLGWGWSLIPELMQATQDRAGHRTARRVPSSGGIGHGGWSLVPPPKR